MRPGGEPAGRSYSGTPRAPVGCTDDLAQRRFSRREVCEKPTDVREVEIGVDRDADIRPVQPSWRIEPDDFEDLWTLAHERRDVLAIAAGRCLCGGARKRRCAHGLYAAS